MQHPPPPASFGPFQYQQGLQQTQMFGPSQGAQFFQSAPSFQGAQTVGTADTTELMK
jgi:hypothetical protein